MNLRTSPALLLCMIPILAGCGEGESPTGQVTGTVTYQGQPLKEGSITFLPAEGRPGYGKIVDGAIKEVFTHEPGDGAPVGMNKVTIQAVENADDMYAPVKSLIPEKYGNPEESGLTADIKKGENAITFDLK